MRTKSALAFSLVVLFLTLGVASRSLAQDVRSVEGAVHRPDNSPAKGAVVKLKNTKTLQVRSYITDDLGLYQFHGLARDADYELRAELNSNGTELASDSKTLSMFDSKKKATIDLKLKSK